VSSIAVHANKLLQPARRINVAAAPSLIQLVTEPSGFLTSRLTMICGFLKLNFVTTPSTWIFFVESKVAWKE